MKKLKSALLDIGLDPCRLSEGADGSQVVLHNAGQVHHKTQGSLCYDNKESSVIYDMASIIDDKSVADQVVQRVVR